MTQLTPFRINIPDDILTDLKYRLAQTRWTDEPDHAEWDYGVNPAYLHKVNVPTGAALFPTDAQYPREWAQRMANIIQFNKMEKGGHFAALEVLELFVNELRKFFRQY